MSTVVRIFLGFDPREAAAYHVCSQSIIEKSSVPVAIYPLHNRLLEFKRPEGSNSFHLSRFLIPDLCDYTGWAIYLDGDMIVNRDIADLWSHRYSFYDKAVCVVPHDYQTAHPVKYLGSSMESPNVDYPKKNQSSVMLWNCNHFGNRILTKEYVGEIPSATLHRLQWLQERHIGHLSPCWNHLVGENPPAPANLFHYTLGVPGIKHYAGDFAAKKWHQALINALACAGEDPVDMVARAKKA